MARKTAVAVASATLRCSKQAATVAAARAVLEAALEECANSNRERKLKRSNNQPATM